MKAALYARVSTTDKDQDPEVQLIRLRRWVVELNLEIYDEYVDIASGTVMSRLHRARVALGKAYREL